jgi:transcriptional regulator with XRE-family HTH domain
VAEEGQTPHSDVLGAYIRAQRRLADLSLRQLAELSDVSNAYLSQLERGLHQPSLKVVQSIAHALNLSSEVLLAEGGLLEKRSKAGHGRLIGLLLAVTRARLTYIAGCVVFQSLRRHASRVGRPPPTASTDRSIL